MSERELQLAAIASHIQSWLDWQEQRNAAAEKPIKLTDDTHVMTLPVPFWPSRGTFKNWIEALSPSGGEAVAWRYKSEHDEWVVTTQDHAALNAKNAGRLVEPLYASVPPPGVVEALKEEPPLDDEELELNGSLSMRLYREWDGLQTEDWDKIRVGAVHDAHNRLRRRCEVLEAALSAKAQAGGEDANDEIPFDHPGLPGLEAVGWTPDMHEAAGYQFSAAEDMAFVYRDLWDGDTTDAETCERILQGMTKRGWKIEKASPQAGETVAGDMVPAPREPNEAQIRLLFTMNSAMPRTTEEAHAVYKGLLNLAPAPASSQPQTEWREIESAPKDGTRIIGWSAERCSNCAPGTVGMSVLFWSQIGWASGTLPGKQLLGTQHQPTHWQPLPVPPISKGSAT